MPHPEDGAEIRGWAQGRTAAPSAVGLRKHMSRILRVWDTDLLPRVLSSASLSTLALSGLEVVVEDIGWAVPAPSSASWLIGVFWSVFLLRSSAQRLWRETFLSASLPTSFFVLATVCFVPPDMVCVSLGGCVYIPSLSCLCIRQERLCLKRDFLSKR